MTVSPDDESPARGPLDPIPAGRPAETSTEAQAAEQAGQHAGDGEMAGLSFVVGGGSRGLGRAVAAELIGRGAQALIIGRDAARLNDASGALGPRAHALAADLAAPESAALVAGAVRERFADGIDGVLINAGGPARGTALELSEESWHEAYELLLGGPIRLVRSIAALLRPGGSLLFVTSSAVRQPVPGLDSSNVLRPAVAALSRALAVELAPRVRVNSVAPGRFDTDRAQEGDARRALAAGIPIERQRAQGMELIPLRRYGDPAELARAAAFLLSPAASYITGATLHVDGGLISSAP